VRSERSYTRALKNRIIISSFSLLHENRVFSSIGVRFMSITYRVRIVKHARPFRTGPVNSVTDKYRRWPVEKRFSRTESVLTKNCHHYGLETARFRFRPENNEPVNERFRRIHFGRRRARTGSRETNFI